MIGPICEKGKVCVYLTKKIVDTVTGKKLIYYCNNPMKFDNWRLPKVLNHEEKFRTCSYKVTNKLGEFINDKPIQ